MRNIYLQDVAVLITLLWLLASLEKRARFCYQCLVIGWHDHGFYEGPGHGVYGYELISSGDHKNKEVPCFGLGEYPVTVFFIINTKSL